MLYDYKCGKSIASLYGKEWKRCKKGQTEQCEERTARHRRVGTLAPLPPPHFAFSFVSAVACSFSTASSSHASPALINSQELRVKNTQNEQQNALRTAEALLSRVERIRTALAQLRSSSEFTELVTFEAAMLNWEAFLKVKSLHVPKTKE